MNMHVFFFPGIIRRLRLLRALSIHGLRSGRSLMLLGCLLIWSSFSTAQEYPLITSATITSDVSATDNDSFKRVNHREDPNVNAPDYVVSSFEGPNSALPGASISLSVNVFNQGGPLPGVGGALDVTWLSDQPSLGGAYQKELARRLTPRLTPGEVDIAFFNVSIPPDVPGGTYYLIYQTDQGNVFEESNEGNNLASFPITIEGLTQPDYISEALNAPATAALGEDFTLSATIRNIGDGPGDGAGGQEDFWLADTPNFSGSVNEFLGRIPTPSLAPNEAIQLETTFTIPENLTPGTYHIIHVVEQDDVIEESDENNNRGIRQIEITNLSLCDVALPLQHLVKTEGNFTNATNQISSYGRGGTYPGREVVYRIDLPPTIWLGGNVYFDLKGDAEKLILLNSCDPTDVFAGPFIDPGTAQMLQASEGTYYIVVEGPSDGSDGNFELTVRRDHLRCSDARPITIGQATAPGPFSPYTYANQYCGDPNATALEGDEAIYEVNWPGGDFRAVLSDMTINAALPWEDAAMILLSDCEDPATCVIPPVINDGASELVMEQENLAAGTYFVVVDGVNGGFNLDFRLTISEMEEPKPDFTVTAASVDTDPIIPGEAFNLTYTIANLGNDDGGAFWIRNFFSTDATYDGTDEQITGGFTFRLDAGGNRTFENASRTLPEGTAQGNYYFIIAIDSDDDNDESDETNNTFALPITVGSSTPTCENPVELVLEEVTDKEHTHEARYNGNTAEGVNNFTTYDNDPRFESTGPEVVHAIDWPGGVMAVSLWNRTAALEVMLLGSCDPTDLIQSGTYFQEPEGGGSEYFEVLLDPGTYYLLVDGRAGAVGTYNLWVGRYEETDCGPASNRLSGQLSADPLTDEACGTELTPFTAAYLQQFEDDIRRFTFTPEMASRSATRIPITAHLMRSSGGAISITEAELDQAVADANALFAPINVEFFVCGINTIVGDTYFDFHKYMQPQLIREHYVPNTINMYFVGTNGCSTLSGYAQFPDPGKPDLVVLAPEAATSDVFSHELGHYFNLLHPHATYYGEELVDRSNCTMAGDLLCDTPADPRLRRSGDRQNVDENCVYFGTETDANGARYTPLTDNVMSYTFPDCMTGFTPQQYDRMAFAVQNLRAYLSCDNPQLPDYQPTNFRARGGSTIVQAGGSLIIDLNIENMGPVAGQGNGGKDEYYLNTTPDLNGSPVFLRDFGTADIPANSLFEVNSGPLTIPASTTPGTYYIVFFHDADERIAESDETNNLAWLEITVQEAGSGLDVSFTASDNSICEGESVQFTSNVSNNANSLTTLYDFSGNGNHGTMQNFDGTPYTDHAGFGKALTFDNVDDYVACGNILPISYTKEVWINPTDEVGNFISGDGTNRDAFWMASNAVRAGQTGNWSRAIDPNPVTDGWQHYAVTYDAASQTMILYRNGVEVASATNVPAAAAPNGIVYLSTYALNDNHFGGQMDEARIWEGARTPAQIQASYNQELSGNEAGLVAYYKFSPSSAGATYNWSIERDGQPIFSSSDPNAGFTFNEPGRYRVSLTVTSEGQTNTEVQFILVEDCTTAPFSVDFTADPTDPCLGQEVQFTAQVDGGVGASQLIDVSGNGNTASLKNFPADPFGTLTSYGQHFIFDGEDDYVELPENLTANLDQFTFEAWYYYEGPAHWQRIMDFGAGTEKYMFLTPSNGVDLKPRAGIRNGGVEGQLNASEDLVPNAWSHFALVIDGRSPSNNARLYINGQLKDQQTFTLKPSDLGNLNQNWLGKSQWPDPYLTGKLDEVRIWRTARTSEQILANMTSELTGAEDGLLAYYNFNQVNPDDLTYSWAFSGGTPATSTEANPTVTYSAPGPVDVSLSVTGGGRSATETKSSYLSVQACEPDWPLTETGDNHTVLVQADASILLNSLPTASTIAVGDYLGVFYYQDFELICAGKAQWTGENLAITVYGDDLTTSDAKEGFGTGESFQWKIWKAATNQEFFGLPTYALPAGIITHTGQFAPDGVSQLIEMTGEISPVRNETQTIGLLPGWNMISSIIKANDGRMADIFAPIVDRIAIVKNGDGQVYLPSMSINDIGNWNVVDGYQVKLLGDGPVTFSLVGQPVDPETTPIPLDAGYNLIAYLQTNAAPAQEAMVSIQDELEILKNGRGQVYIPSLGINNVGTMLPGEGYKVKVSQATALTYTANRMAPTEELHMARQNPYHYQPSRTGGPNATLILQTQGLVDYGDEIGVFDTEGRLVGAATYEDHILAFPIWGDDPTTDAVDGLAEGASFELRVWSKATNAEAVVAFSANTDRFATDGVIEAELLRSTSLASTLEANRIQLYPNPTRGVATLSLSLTQTAQVEAALYDLAGKQLLSIANETLAAGRYELSFQTAQLPGGLYHCRILVEGELINLPFSVLK